MTYVFVSGFIVGIVSFMAAIGMFSWMQRNWDKQLEEVLK
jgi:hypothetical protein